MRSISFLLLLLGLTAAGCKRQGSATVFVDPALATLVPADTAMLAGVRMEKLAKTKFWSDYVRAGRVPMVQRFEKETGLHVERDLWEVLVASNAKEAVVLIRGKFADMGLEPTLEREGAQRMSYKGFVMIGDDRTAVLFLNPSTAAAGPTAALRRVVDNRDRITGIPAALDARIKKISGGNQAWFVSQAAGLLPDVSGAQAGVFTGLARVANSVTFASGALDLSSQFSGRLDLETKDDASADKVGGAVRGLLGIGRLNTASEQREVLSVFDGLAVTREGSVVHLNAAIPYSVLENAARELPGLGLK